MTDHYSALGINTNSTDDEVRQAYMRQAREHHPDKGGDKDAFQRIQAAYEVLSDPAKRSQYDAVQNTTTQFQQFHFHFRESRMGKVQKEDVVYSCKITLRDVFYGVTKKFKAYRSKLCKNCFVDCPSCNGLGQMTHKFNMGFLSQVIQQDCNRCNGKGKCRRANQCELCMNGNITEENIFEINVPKGAESGKKYVIPGWGRQPTNNIDLPGDLVVDIFVEEHDVFKRHGLDLVFACAITLQESIFGKTIHVPLFDETISVDTRGFGIINPNKQYTMLKLGLRSEDNTPGDLHVKFEIIYPEKSLTQDQARTIEHAFKCIDL